MNRDVPVPTVDSTAAFVRLDSRPVPRVTRMMRVAAEMGMAPTFLGAPRKEGLPRTEEWEGMHVERVGPVQPMLNGAGLRQYVVGTLWFNAAVFSALRKVRPGLVHASDVESAPACILYTKLHRVPFIYNIHDNFADRYVVPDIVRFFLNALEGLFVQASASTVVPESFRRQALPPWVHRKVSVVRNTPVDIGRTVPPPTGERVRVLYAGWLDNGRGLSALLTLSSRHSDLEL